jgi:glycosyltransferase involved in cell wall biosynthesis
MSERYLALIPVLNGAGSIAGVIRGCLPHVDSVVVVDDGSSDGTGDIAKNAGATVLRHDVNRGKGAALKTGFKWAVDNGYDGVITLDADGQHLPDEIPRFLAAHRDTKADLIIGGRAHLFAEMLPRRRRANQFSARTISIASGHEVTDSQSGFRFYSAPLLRRVKLRTDGFDMESDVIVRAGRHGFTIHTIPIGLGFVDGLSTSHYKPLKDTVRIAWTVVKAFLHP